MRSSVRAAIAALAFCVAASTTGSAPSFAMDLPETPSGTASAMLAAVTAPLLAVNVRTLEAAEPDFSSPRPDPAADKSGSGITLDALVDANAATAEDDETRCLAATVYYESHGEPLSGQLAVAQTIVNRSHSGNFPDSICGVVKQPGQFSVMHRGELPAKPSNDGAWHHALAIAAIARQGLWKQIAPAALYFHARQVAPGWGRVRVASIGNHVFFR